jgi:hypothetical protein
VLAAIDGIPPREGLMLLSESEYGEVDDGIFAVTDHNGSNMFLNIGGMVEIGPMEGLFVSFDLIGLIILRKRVNT